MLPLVNIPAVALTMIVSPTLVTLWQVVGWVVGIVVGTVVLASLLNYLSYGVLKTRIVSSQSWGLNICCGKTDGGGVNADIVQHGAIPNYVRIVDIYNLPFADGQFETVLSSHTIEHVDDPERFFKELKRVGKEVTLVLPPLWDFSAALNILEHRHIFLTMTKKHHTLPPYVVLPFAKQVHALLGQRIHA